MPRIPNVILAGVMCKCGREPFVHCPACGSTNVNGKRSAGRVTKVNGVDVRIRGFVCRHCSQEFAEDAPCAAEPMVTRSRSMNREEGMSDNYGKAKPDSELVNNIVKGLRELNPAKYGNLKLPSTATEEEGSVTDTSQDEFFGRK